MLRFSVKDLMIATLLVAVGLAIEIGLMRCGGAVPDKSFFLFFVVFGIGVTIIGAGALLPFRKKAVGAGINFVLAGLLLLFGGAIGF